MAAENYQKNKVTNKLPATISNNQNISTWYPSQYRYQCENNSFLFEMKLWFFCTFPEEKKNVKIKTWQNFKDTRLIFLYLFSFATEAPTLVFRIYFVLCCCCYENWVSACGITTNATCALPFSLVGMSMSVSIRHKVQCLKFEYENSKVPQKINTM